MEECSWASSLQYRDTQLLFVWEAPRHQSPRGCSTLEPRYDDHAQLPRHQQAATGTCAVCNSLACQCCSLPPAQWQLPRCYMLNMISVPTTHQQAIAGTHVYSHGWQCCSLPPVQWQSSMLFQWQSSILFMLKSEQLPMPRQQAVSSTCGNSPGWQCCSFLASLWRLSAAVLQTQAKGGQLLSIASCCLCRAGCACACPAVLLSLHAHWPAGLSLLQQPSELHHISLPPSACGNGQQDRITSACQLQPAATARKMAHRPHSTPMHLAGRHKRQR